MSTCSLSLVSIKRRYTKMFKEKDCKLVVRAVPTDNKGDRFPHFVSFSRKDLVDPSYARVVVNMTSDRRSKDCGRAAFRKLFLESEFID